MAEYVDKESVLSMIRPDDPYDEHAAVKISDAKHLMRTLINRAPVADVVGVVRCEDCKYFYPHVDYYRGKTYDYGFCEYWEKETLGEAPQVNDSDFCSHVERKD